MAEEKKKYTFSDKRGRDRDDACTRRESTGEDLGTGEDSTGSSSQEAIDFCTLIMSFASAAMIGMGKVPDPVTGQINKDLVMARQNIDILSLLRDKTSGNLSEKEDKLMESILYDLRISYVESQKR